MTTAKRVLVLGVDQLGGGATAYSWNGIPARLNVADFDAVVLVACTLSDQRLRDSLDARKLPHWASYARLLLSTGEVVVMGRYPRRRNSDGTWQGPDVLDWLPAQPRLVPQAGETISVVDEEWAWYFKFVKSWRFHAGPDWTWADHASKFGTVIQPACDDTQAELKNIALTRAGFAIAYSIEYEVRRPEVHDFGTDSVLVARSGRVVQLPTPTEVTPRDAVEALLRERYSVGDKTPPPAWVSTWLLPSMTHARQAYERASMEAVRAETSVHEHLIAYEETVRVHHLLFGQSDALEDAVEHALGRLGGTVSRRPAREEDLCVTLPDGSQAVVEVKGKNSLATLQELRQLDDWVSRAVERTGSDSVLGILVFNGPREIDPRERTRPFDENCVAFAKRKGLILVTTTQLFRALLDHETGVLTEADFWNAIRRANPCAPLPELA